MDKDRLITTVEAVPIQNIPVAKAFAQVVPVQSKWTSIIPPQLWGILQASNVFSVRQHVKLLPKACCACPPCVKQENTYSIYAGFNNDAQSEIFRVDEVSDDWNRCCCAPYHPLRMEVRQYIPMPGDGTGSDYRHLAADVTQDVGRFTGRDGQQRLREFYMHNPPLMSIVRDDGLRCCCKCPCKLLSCFVCAACCQDGVHVYAGGAQDDPEGEKGRPFNLDHNNLIGSVLQPQFGGWCWPTLHLRGELSDDTSEPYGKIEGPCIFGGWSEMCCDFQFATSRFKSERGAADLAMITKKKPASAAGAFVELFSNSDYYQIEFNPQANLSAGEKATIISGQLFADYMYFDGNTEKCKNDSNAIYCYCFYCSVIGKLIPCYIMIPKNN